MGTTSERSRSSGSSGAKKIITPRMLEAGVRVLTTEYDLVGSEMIAEGIVRRVFSEMVLAASRQQRKSRSR
jgi:hypothetical protein